MWASVVRARRRQARAQLKKEQARLFCMDRKVGLGSLDWWDVVGGSILVLVAVASFVGLVWLVGTSMGLPVARAHSDAAALVPVAEAETESVAHVARATEVPATARFEPTYEWQEVQAGVAIPSVRESRGT
jgi:hypothetical protein